MVHKTSPPRKLLPQRASSWSLLVTWGLFLALCFSMVTGHVPGTNPATGSERVTMSGDRPVRVAETTPIPAGVPDKALKAYHQGTEALTTGHYKDAGEAFKHALEKFPPFAAAYLGLAQSLNRRQDKQGAELNALHAVDLLNKSDDTYIDASADALLARAYQLLGETLLEQAQHHLNQENRMLGRMEANRAAGYCQKARARGGEVLSCLETAQRLGGRRIDPSTTSPPCL